jgi:hypothetical protein
MTMKLACITGTVAFGLYVAATVPIRHLSSVAFAQASDMAGIARTESASARAVVQSIDLQTRVVTLTPTGGDTLVVEVEDLVRNLPHVQVGDTVTAHYYTPTAYVLAPQGTKLPADSSTWSAPAPSKVQSRVTVWEPNWRLRRWSLVSIPPFTQCLLLIPAVGA